MIKRIFVFLLALILCWGTAVSVVYAQGDVEQADGESGEKPDGIDAEQEPINDEEQSEETADEDTVSSEGELYNWCSEHRNSGGRVTLGGNITITESISISNGNGHIVIDTGQYGLVYDGGSIHLSRFEIIGEGVDIPVLDIQTVIQYGYFWESGWNDVVRELNITAAGRDGTGGIAVRVRQDDGYSARYSNYMTEGSIRSYGTGAIGLYLDEPLDAYCFQIEVEGDGSSAVYAEQGATLYYCKLTAQGAGASAVSGSGEIVVDTCVTSPEPQDVQVINYRIIGVSGSRLYYPVRQHGDIDYLDYYIITFLLSAGEGHPSVTQAFSINWEYDFIDTGVLGRITIHGSFDPPFQGLGLEGDFPLELIVDVRDPDIPCINRIWFNEDVELGSYVILYFWDTYEREDENAILWCSDDDGESWYELTDSPDIEWRGDEIYYYYGEITGLVMLQLKVLGKGESNIVTLSSVDGHVYGGLGGDRDGGDRNAVSGSNSGNSTDVGNSTEGEDSSGVDNSPCSGNTSDSNNGTGSGNSSGDNVSFNGGNSSGNGNATGDGGSSGSGDSTDGNSSTGDNASENDHSSGCGDTSDNGNGSNSGGGAGNEDTSGSGSKTDNNDSDSGDKADSAIPATSTQNDNGLISATAGIIQETVAAETEEAAAPEEWENGDSIAISGRRLAAMIEANPKAVTFIKNGIQISIALADLLALGLDENKLFLVEIKKLAGNSFSVLFRADDIELSDLPFVAYIGEAVFDGVSLASVVCVDENGNVLPSEYDPGAGKLSVSMTGPGIFTLQAEQLSEVAVLVRDNGGVQEQERERGGQPGEPSSPLNAGMIVAGICAVFLPAGGFVWRKRRLARR